MDRDLLLEALKVPPEFDFPVDNKTPVLLDELSYWKDASLAALHALATSQNDFELESAEDKASLTFALAPFISSELWSSSAHRTASDGLLQRVEVTKDTLTVVLKEHVKPLFVATAHPLLNLETGRKLSRPAGGSATNIDLYENQVWKTNIGVCDIVTFCLTKMSSTHNEALWPLLIPPIMTILDDREGKWRLRALSAVSTLLDNVPSDLLSRTGVKDLLDMSLNNTIMFTHNPETPQLVAKGITSSLKLIKKTTAPFSERRFDQLCNLLGKTIIGSLWVYAANDVDTIQESHNGLVPIMRLLGIGTTRYLTAIIPELMSHVMPHDFSMSNTPLVLSALSALQCVIHVCSVRMDYWKWTILDGACRRWVVVYKAQNPQPGHAEMVAALRRVCECLEDACPEIRKDDFSRILTLDFDTFRGLF